MSVMGFDTDDDSVLLKYGFGHNFSSSQTIVLIGFATNLDRVSHWFLLLTLPISRQYAIVGFCQARICDKEQQFRHERAYHNLSKGCSAWLF